MSDTVYKLVYFQPFEGYEILGEFDTEEEAEAAAVELLKREPKAFHAIARVPRGESAAGGEK